MTVSTSYGFDLDLQGIARNALRLAGVLGSNEEPQPSEVQMVGEFANMRLKGWQAASRLLRQVETVTKSLVPGTASVVVDADTMDIEFPAYLSPVTGTQTYNVERITLDDYMRLPNKSESGIPEVGLVKREAAVSLVLWPVPNSTMASITYTRVRLIRDLRSGSTADLQQRYVHALVLAIATDCAEHYNKDDQKIGRLENRFMNAKADVMSDNVERGPVKFSLRG